MRATRRSSHLQSKGNTFMPLYLLAYVQLPPPLTLSTLVFKRTPPLFSRLNLLGPKNDQHQFSPNNISRSLRVKVMRITKLITKGRNALILKQILSTTLKRNIWRSVWRVGMWILGIKGLRNLQKSPKSIYCPKTSALLRHT